MMALASTLAMVLFARSPAPVLAAAVQQAVSAESPAKPSAIRFVLQTSALRKHATVINNELTITAGADEPYVSEANFGDFEAWGEIGMPEPSAVRLLVHATVGRSWHLKDHTEVAVPALPNYWRQMRVRCVGGHLTVSIGGDVVFDQDVRDDERGRLGFAVDEGQLSLRRWAFVRRDAYLSPEPLLSTIPDASDVVETGKDVAAPRLRKEVKPQYTASAMSRRVTGDVELEAIVETDGSVGPVRVTKSLDDDLDWQAVKAVREWRFEPAVVNGRAVRCRITVVLSFTL
jgi:protein TonB